MWCADSVYLCGVLMAVVCSAVWGVRCVLCLLSVSHCIYVGCGYGVRGDRQQATHQNFRKSAAKILYSRTAASR